MDLASVVAALASVGVRVSGSNPNNNIQGDSSRACPTGLAGPEPSGTHIDPGQHFHSGRTLLVCCATCFAKCNKFNRPTPPVTFSFDRANRRQTGACAVLASLLTSNGALTFPLSGAHPSAYPMSCKVWGILRSRCCRALATVVIRAARSSMARCPAQYVGLCFS